MKTIIVVVACMLMWGGQALAGCTTTVTASTPTADFIDHGNGTVTDSRTGLMWKQCSEGLTGVGCRNGAGAAVTPPAYTWQGAFQVAEINATGGFAGFTDWRVPNIKELSSIVETQCTSPAINAIIFPDTAINVPYWSSSPDTALATHVWVVDFRDGTVGVQNKIGINFLRLVRGGQ